MTGMGNRNDKEERFLRYGLTAFGRNDKGDSRSEPEMTERIVSGAGRPFLHSEGGKMMVPGAGRRGLHLEQAE